MLQLQMHAPPISTRVMHSSTSSEYAQKFLKAMRKSVIKSLNARQATTRVQKVLGLAHNVARTRLARFPIRLPTPARQAGNPVPDLSHARKKMSLRLAVLLLASLRTLNPIYA